MSYPRLINENTMRKLDLATMRFEELWQLYEELANVLADRITTEKHALEDRLAKLDPVEIVKKVRSSPPLSLTLTERGPRRKYPKVPPKYCNPLAPSQKWSGRGKRPRWVIAALDAGQELEDLKIEHVQRSQGKKKRPHSGT